MPRHLQVSGRPTHVATSPKWVSLPMEQVFSSQRRYSCMPESVEYQIPMGMIAR
jgi:hypothetical protein